MFKKFALTTATLASVFTATLALSGAAHADDQWNWRHRNHFQGNRGGHNWGGPPPGTFLFDRWRGGGWGGPGFFFGGPVYGDGYYDDPGYWPDRNCKVRKVRRSHHWVWRKVCNTY